MRSIYRAIMDPKFNPLRSLPAAQKFQIMAILGTMWTIIFCTGLGAWLWFGELIVLHLLVAGGFMVTGVTFHRATVKRTYRDHPASDGTARYDDVWGA